jgi:Rps23 Pro-64 3,4-dihydroxylase Tpa1-like proline 4-hydroxylase
MNTKLATTGTPLACLAARLENATLCRFPWDHIELPGFLSEDMAATLGAAFDAVTLDRYEKDQAHKPYKLYNRLLPSNFEAPLTHWQEIATYLQGAEYRASIARLIGHDLDACRVTLNMWAYGPGDWLGPHLDHSDKVITQIFYLSREWKPEDGGSLALLTREDMASMVRRIPARFGDSFVFLRSDRSWHAVEPIAVGGTIRRSMTLTYWSNH